MRVGLVQHSSSALLIWNNHEPGTGTSPRAEVDKVHAIKPENITHGRKQKLHTWVSRKLELRNAKWGQQDMTSKKLENYWRKLSEMGNITSKHGGRSPTSPFVCIFRTWCRLSSNSLYLPLSPLTRALEEMCDLIRRGIENVVWTCNREDTNIHIDTTSMSQPVSLMNRELSQVNTWM